MTNQYVREEYPLSEITSRIIKAAKEVHKELGSGFEEVLYQRSLALEFPTHGLDFSREVWIDVHYKGQKVGRKRVDFIVEEVLVEIKAKAVIEDVDFTDPLLPQGLRPQGCPAAQLWSQAVGGQADSVR